ncbi:MAG: hypothetical protein ACPLPR_03360 [Bacillota bacterium]
MEQAELVAKPTAQVLIIRRWFAVPYFKRRTYLFGLIKVYKDQDQNVFVRLGGKLWKIRSGPYSGSQALSSNMKKGA